MAKTNVSEWDIVASNNITINGINIDENCPPSTINNAIREMMSQIKMWKDGYTDPLTGLPVYQSLTVQNIDVKGIIKLNGSAGTDGQVLVSKGASASPVWGNAFVRGMIMLWTGTVAPTGWALCNGSSGTPDLRDKFVMGSGGSQPTTGGYADATLVSHNHTFSGSTSSAGNHSHGGVPQTGTIWYDRWNATGGTHGNERYGGQGGNTAVAGNHAHSFSGTTNTKGSGGTNKNLPPYYALAYIMKL